MERHSPDESHEVAGHRAAVAYGRVHLHRVESLARNGIEQLKLAELHLLALETEPSDPEAIAAAVRAFSNLRQAARRLKLRDLHYYAADHERLLREALDASLIPETTVDTCLDAIDILTRYLGYVSETLATGEVLPSPRMLPSLRHSAESLGTRMRVADTITPEEARKRLGELLVQSGALTESELQEALFDCAHVTPQKPIGEVLIEEIRISREQLTRAVETQANDPAHPLLGEVLAGMGAVSHAGVARALAKQKQPMVHRLGEALVRAGRVPAKRVVLALRRQGVVRDAVRFGLATLAARFAARATATGHPQQRNRLSPDETAALSRFHREAFELLDMADRNLLALEAEPEDFLCLAAVRRAVNAVSRFASYLGMADIARFGRAFAGYLAHASRKRFRLEGPRLDVAFECVEVLRRHLGYVAEALESDGRIRRETQLPEYIAFLRALSAGRHDKLRIGRFRPPGDSHKLGDILVASGLVSREALETALAEQAETPETVKLGELLVEEALVSRDQLEAALSAQRDNPSAGKLGEILVKWGLVEREEIEAALARQRTRGRPRLGELLVRTGAVPAKAVAQALRYQRAGLAGTTAATLVASSFLTPAAAAQPSLMQTSGDAAIVWVMGAENTLDSDQDGLLDVVEMALGTDPYNPDTDGDGMLDGWEVWHGLNPLDPSDAHEDPDGDSISNLDEFRLGTNPFLADSDGDKYWDSIEVARGADPASAASYPHSQVFGDVDADGRVTATDVQYVINAALGLDTPVPANVNRVGGVNALDVQAVISAILGLRAG